MLENVYKRYGQRLIKKYSTKPLGMKNTSNELLPHNVSQNASLQLFPIFFYFPDSLNIPGYGYLLWKPSYRIDGTTYEAVVSNRTVVTKNVSGPGTYKSFKANGW